MFGAQRETGKAKETSNNALDYSSNRGVPFFDKVASKNVTALLGKTAYLSCRVKNLGNKTVSNFLLLHTNIHTYLPTELNFDERTLYQFRVKFVTFLYF